MIEMNSVNMLLTNYTIEGSADELNTVTDTTNPLVPTLVTTRLTMKYSSFLKPSPPAPLLMDERVAESPPNASFRAGDLGNHTSSEVLTLRPSNLATRGSPGDPSSSRPENRRCRHDSLMKCTTASSPVWHVAFAVTSTNRISWLSPYTCTG